MAKPAGALSVPAGCLRPEGARNGNPYMTLDEGGIEDQKHACSHPQLRQFGAGDQHQSAENADLQENKDAAAAERVPISRSLEWPMMGWISRPVTRHVNERTKSLWSAPVS